MNEFAGKVALVTGGNSGIGRAAAIAFAKRGANVVVAARRIEQGEQTVSEIKAGGGEAFFVRADVSKSGDVESLVGCAVDRYGQLNFAFNNAASEPGPPCFTADVAEDEFSRVMDVNLKGIWLCLKYEIQQMLRQDPPGGAIVNTSSVNGLGGVAGGAIYAASKAGVIALTKSAAQEYATRGIRVNALAAGAFRTPMLESVLDARAGGDPETRQTLEDRFKQMIPQGRIADPSEAAEAAVWLCSDGASYVTGHSMIVDGGLTAYAR